MTRIKRGIGAVVLGIGYVAAGHFGTTFILMTAARQSCLFQFIAETLEHCGLLHPLLLFVSGPVGFGSIWLGRRLRRKEGP